MRKRAIVLALGAILALVVGWQITAFASHGEASLAGSNFEIDNDANLKVDDTGQTDWASLAHPNGPELRATDLDTGQNDDSYKGGVKEDTECPGETTGSIPNNKSDLLTFHLNEEAGTVAGDPGFLNLAWSRVSDPSGTTLMDFEFNQSDLDDPDDACAQGPNVQRTEGDLLIEYAIDQGGARADISGRFWNGSAWGPHPGPRRALPRLCRPGHPDCSEAVRSRHDQPIGHSSWGVRWAGREAGTHVWRGTDRP